MLIEEAVGLIKKELECVNRNVEENCNRMCSDCDLVRGAAEIKQAYQMAISALEKQIPKVPVMDYGFAEKIRQAMIRNGDKEKAEYKTDCCPICKRPLGVSKFVQSQTGLRFGDLYCKHCGQAILWE